MQWRLVVEGCILGFLRDLESFGEITRTAVLRPLRSMSEGLRVKSISNLLPPPCYFLLKSRYLGSRILKKVFISSGGELRVLGTSVIGLKHRGSASEPSEDTFKPWIRSILRLGSFIILEMNTCFDADELSLPIDFKSLEDKVSVGKGLITSHALMSLEARGILFVSPGMEAYEGMIVGEHSRDSDLDINPVRTKELNNIRAAGKDENVRLSPPRLMSLEEAIGYVAADELIEVTPKVIRLRNKYLDATKRKMMKNKPMD
ncbi:hypothetical protein GUJ93_ZPchr0001g30911 [Zizania palustris]|uniref:TypA/BipA C-terminal domain-containing protein n=1 Tax=Zizania palustris TaxID=103762 RepID=A0A8J5RV60_ZIZPA|nr:hypothetical protein GUJ93_ZPchr0001g30911 [Zizania palustris]